MEGPTQFAVVNVWAQLPRYEEDLLNCVRAARRVLPSDSPLLVPVISTAPPLSVRSHGEGRRCPERYARSLGLVGTYHQSLRRGAWTRAAGHVLHEPKSGSPIPYRLLLRAGELEGTNRVGGDR